MTLGSDDDPIAFIELWQFALTVPRIGHIYERVRIATTIRDSSSRKGLVMRFFARLMLACAALFIFQVWTLPARAECTPCQLYCVGRNCGCAACKSPPNCAQCNACNVFACNCDPCAYRQSCLGVPGQQEATLTAQANNRCRRMFEEIDSNKNKTISKAEFRSWIKVHRKEFEGRTTDTNEELFAQVDKNGDGRLTIDEAGCGK